MSATEVIEEIKKLPRAEQQKAAAFVHEIESAGAAKQLGDQVSDSFKRIADEVFATNAELLRKLAQ